MVFFMLRYVPAIPTLVGLFIMDECWILSNAFSASIEMIMGFLKFLLLFLKSFFFFFFFFFFFWPHLLHMEFSRLGVKSELQLPAYTTATSDPNHICDLHHNSWQFQIFNPLSEARDRIRHLMVLSWIHFLCTTMGNPCGFFKFSFVHVMYYID